VGRAEAEAVCVERLCGAVSCGLCGECAVWSVCVCVWAGAVWRLGLWAAVSVGRCERWGCEPDYWSPAEQRGAVGLCGSRTLESPSAGLGLETAESPEAGGSSGLSVVLAATPLAPPPVSQ
jgi:hypothetical protein